MKTRFDLNDIYPQLTRVETTVGTNGYPSKLQYAYYCDSKKEMQEIIEEIRGDGYNIIELFIRKKNGWQLWNRDEQDHSMINLDYVKDSDWALSIDMDNSVDEIKSDIYYSLIGDDEDYIEDLGVDRCVKIVENFYNDIKGYIGKGEITVFYTPEQDNGIDYVITDDCTGYHDGDVTTYQMAFSVEQVELIETEIKTYKSNAVVFFSVDDENIGSVSVNFDLTSNEDFTFDEYLDSIRDEILDGLDELKEDEQLLNKETFEFEFNKIAIEISPLF